MKKVKALIITGYGLNCENETAAAFKICGAEAVQIHLNDISKKDFDKAHILAFIGGFSFGDHLGAGTVFSNRIKFRFKDELLNFVNKGKLIIGICNGFQTITRLGLVPALKGNYFRREAALAHNDSGLFRDDWVYLKGNPQSPCVFTKGIDIIRLPIRHGEGKFVAEEKNLAQIEKKNLVCLRYCDEYGNSGKGFPINPNGSLNDIAGICDETGRVFGLMPHPEAFLSPFNSTDWTRQIAIKGEIELEGQGAIIFRNAVDFAQENLV